VTAVQLGAVEHGVRRGVVGTGVVRAASVSHECMRIGAGVGVAAIATILAAVGGVGGGVAIITMLVSVVQERRRRRGKRRWGCHRPLESCQSRLERIERRRRIWVHPITAGAGACCRVIGICGGCTSFDGGVGVVVVVGGPPRLVSLVPTLHNRNRGNLLA
jgi:hypothetical protein